MTTTSNSIQLAHSTRDEWAVLADQATTIARSDLLPASYYGANNAPRNYELAANKVIAVSMMGRELGIPTWAAVNNITVINGKPTISPQLMLSLIYRSGQLRNLVFDVQDDQVSCTMHRVGMDSAHTEIFSMKDAQKMQLAGKDNWGKQPKTMMKWRAVAACARIVFPDVVLGMYTQDEMGANVTYADDGSVETIEEGVFTESDHPKSPALPQPAAPSSTGSATTGAANGGSDDGHVVLFSKTDQIAKTKLADFFVENGFADKAKRVDWKRALEETRAMTGQQIEGFGDLTGYKTIDEFFNAMRDHFKTIADAMPKAAPKSTKKFEWTDDLIKTNGVWMLDHFGLSPDFGLVNTAHGKIAEYDSQDAFRADVIKTALEGAWQVNSRSVTYDGKGSPIVFHTAIGDIRLYSRTKLQEMIGAELYESLGLNVLTDDYKGTVNFPESFAVKIDWIKQGDVGKEYFVAEKVADATEIPF